MQDHRSRRRRLLTASMTVGAVAVTTASARAVAQTIAPTTAPPSPAEIEARIGGRLGVYALDTGSGRELAHRADERYAMCSTFKWLLGAAVLARSEHSPGLLDEPITYGSADLLEYAPITRSQLAQGALSIGALARAAITVSDNTAANLLLTRLGGPAALTRFVRANGDRTTRLDRNESALNSNVVGDPRDTTTPRAMAHLMRTLLCGAGLAPTSRAQLIGWLRDCETGAQRLRAGLPNGWVVGDKTGTGWRGAIGDLAIAVPPGRAPILITAYCSDSSDEAATLAAAHADVARFVAHSFART